VRLLISDFITRRPYAELKEIQFVLNEWVLQLDENKEYRYAKATILIDNVLFLLIKFTNQDNKKFIVLFHDQVAKNQIRLFRLKTSKI